MYRYVRSSTDSSIQWKHRDEEDRSYDYGTFDVNGKKFSVTRMYVDKRVPKFEGKWFVESVHPYDNTEYHWARYDDKDSSTTYFLKGSVVDRTSHVINNDRDVVEVARHLLELDQDAGLLPRIDNS